VKTEFLKYLIVFPLAASLYAQAKLPDGPGKDTFIRICSSCHGAQIVIGKGNNEEGWTQVVLNMIGRGAQGTEDEFGEVVQYLTQNFPLPNTEVKINVNKASADELKAQLDLSAKEAEAIVAQRAKNGDFKSLEQLEKVPGLDASKIEAKRARITF
jgi:competence protein ComEA